MLEQAGALLPAAAGIALSPFPVVAVTLVVSGPRGRASGPAFALGWVAGLAVLTTVAVLLGELVGDDEPARWTSWARVLLGAGLLALGARKLLRRPADDGPTTPPGWAAGLIDAGPGRATLTAVVLAAANPKNVAFALASAATVGQAAQDAPGVVVQGALFVVLASATVLGVLGVDLLGGAAGRRGLEALRLRLLRHAAVISAVVLVLIGAAVLGQGLSGIG